MTNVVIIRLPESGQPDLVPRRGREGRGIRHETGERELFLAKGRLDS